MCRRLKCLFCQFAVDFEIWSANVILFRKCQFKLFFTMLKYLDYFMKLTIFRSRQSEHSWDGIKLKWNPFITLNQIAQEAAREKKKTYEKLCYPWILYSEKKKTWYKHDYLVWHLFVLLYRLLLCSEYTLKLLMKIKFTTCPCSFYFLRENQMQFSHNTSRNQFSSSGIYLS